jgi:Tripartite tricarboxylate transporter TctB family
MKLNAKDLISAALLIGSAVIGLWLNQDHNLGTARRMGSGYMPMLVFWLQIMLGSIVLFLGVFNGPDPLEKWTKPEIGYLIGGTVAGIAAGLIAAKMPGFPSSGWNAFGIGLFVGCMVCSVPQGWRALFLPSAAFALFGLLLEPLGLMVAIVAAVIVSAVADQEHLDRPWGIAGLCAFLCVLCWGIFIYYLDIRVPLWPQL